MVLFQEQLQRQSERDERIVLIKSFFILILFLLPARSSSAQSIYGTNVVYYNDQISTNGGATWTDLFAGQPSRQVIITDTNANGFYRAEHRWVTNTVNATLAVLYVYRGDSPETISETNVTAATGIFINHSLTNSLFRPWVTITNFPIIFPDSGSTNLPIFDPPPIPSIK